jgi:hypothetical protein
MPKIAQHVKNLTGFTGLAALYRLSEPLKGYDWGDEPGPPQYEYVVVSAAVATFSGAETYIFGSNERGEVVSWTELRGSMRGTLDHAAALENAGYQVGVLA